MTYQSPIDPAALADVTLSHQEIKRYSRHLIMPEVGMNAVSYTHLDVYKRQCYYRPNKGVRGWVF